MICNWGRSILFKIMRSPQKEGIIRLRENKLFCLSEFLNLILTYCTLPLLKKAETLFYHSKTGPFANRTHFDHSNTGLIRYLEGYCCLVIWSFFKPVLDQSWFMDQAWIANHWTTKLIAYDPNIGPKEHIGLWPVWYSSSIWKPDFPPFKMWTSLEQ